MERKENLTNEKIRKRFISQFDLVNYAISLAANMIQSGRDCRIKMDSQNRAMQILGEIYHEKDQFDEILPPPQEENFERRSYNENRDEQDGLSVKNKERKKHRKLLVE